MIYDLFLITSMSWIPHVYRHVQHAVSLYEFFLGGQHLPFYSQKAFSVNFWTLVRGHRVQIIVPQGGWHLQFIDPQGGWHPPFYIIKWQVGPPPEK